MKKTMKVLMAAAMVFVVMACAEAKVVRCKGPVKVQEMDLEPFTSVVVNGSADIFIVQQNDVSVSVRANEEVFNYLDFKVKNGVLYVETKDRVNIMAEVYDITIGIPDIKALTVNGACDVKFKDGFKCQDNLAMKVNGAGDLLVGGLFADSLHIEVNGAGDVDAESIDVETLAVSVNGAGDVLVSGKADVAFFKVSGAGMIDARGLEAGSVETKRAGVAVIRLP